MRTSTLDNGITIVSEHIPGVRSAAIGVWIRVGGAHERAPIHGASHLLEHMVFKGTERRSAAEIALALEALGGSLDAYTSREHTSYQARVLDEHVPEALDVLADLVLHPLLRDEDLDLEREVVLEEIAQVQDTPDDLVFELHSDRLWGAHPYGRSILGTSESVAAMSGGQLRTLHEAHYVGTNLVVAGAGNLDHDHFVERVARLFGETRPGVPTEHVDVPRETATGVARVGRDSAQTHLVFGGLGPEYANEDRHTVALLASALGGGMSSRLFQRVREELGLCYSIFSFQSSYRSAGMVGVYVGTRPATEDHAAEAVGSELARVAAEGLPEDELARTKQQLKGQIMLSLESTSSRLYRLASFAVHDEPYVGLSELLDKIDAVRSEDAARVARAYFDPELHLELRLGPGG